MLMDDDGFVSFADLIENLLGSFMLIGQHIQRYPFGADGIENAPAGTLLERFHAVFGFQPPADRRHISMALLKKGTLMAQRTGGWSLCFHFWDSLNFCLHHLASFNIVHILSSSIAGDFHYQKLKFLRNLGFYRSNSNISALEVKLLIIF